MKATLLAMVILVHGGLCCLRAEDTSALQMEPAEKAVRTEEVIQSLSTAIERESEKLRVLEAELARVEAAVLEREVPSLRPTLKPATLERVSEAVVHASPAGLTRAADLLFECGEYERAAELYEKTAALNEDGEGSGWSGFQYAQCLYRTGQYESAASVFEALSKRASGSYWGQQAQWWAQWSLWRHSRKAGIRMPKEEREDVQ